MGEGDGPWVRVVVRGRGWWSVGEGGDPWVRLMVRGRGWWSVGEGGGPWVRVYRVWSVWRMRGIWWGVCWSKRVWGV